MLLLLLGGLIALLVLLLLSLLVVLVGLILPNSEAFLRELLDPSFLLVSLVVL
jgi:hypothetical protein